MRIALLCSSAYSETGCAVASRLAQLGYVPVGALTLPSWDPGTLLRKIGQWGVRESARYAVSKLGAKLRPAKAATREAIRNPYLEAALRGERKTFCNLREVAAAYKFPVVTCADQNSTRAIVQLKRWSPDLVIFTGGNILRKNLLQVPRLGVLNAHLALLPEIRGMSSPEWSLVCGVPLGITIHFIDSGIDTGPILLRSEFAGANDCDSLEDLRDRMIAESVELMCEAVSGLHRGTISAVAQADREKNYQFFVMHERLKLAASRRLEQRRLSRAGASVESGSLGGCGAGNG